MQTNDHSTLNYQYPTLAPELTESERNEKIYRYNITLNHETCVCEKCSSEVPNIIKCIDIIIKKFRKDGYDIYEMFGVSSDLFTRINEKRCSVSFRESHVLKIKFSEKCGEHVPVYCVQLQPIQDS